MLGSPPSHRTDVASIDLIEISYVEGVKSHVASAACEQVSKACETTMYEKEKMISILQNEVESHSITDIKGLVS